MDHISKLKKIKRDIRILGINTLFSPSRSSFSSSPAFEQLEGPPSSGTHPRPTQTIFFGKEARGRSLETYEPNRPTIPNPYIGFFLPAVQACRPFVWTGGEIWAVYQYHDSMVGRYVV